jgi:hypothetical protein
MHHSGAFAPRECRPVSEATTTLIGCDKRYRLHIEPGDTAVWEWEDDEAPGGMC